MIEPKDEISVARQCGLLDVARSSYYYESAGETTLNLELMRLIDEQYLKTPFYGSPRMTAELEERIASIIGQQYPDFTLGTA